MKLASNAFNRENSAFVLVFLLSIFFFSAFHSLFDFPDFSASGLHLLASAAFFNRFFVEYIAALLLIPLFISRGLATRIAGHALLVTFILVNLTQVFALHRGREFLSQTAMDNASHVTLLVTPVILLLGVLVLLLLAGMIYGLERLPVDNGQRKFLRWKTVLPLVLMAFVFQQSHFWMPSPLKGALNGYLHKNNVEYTSPMLAFYKTVFEKDDFKKASITALEAAEARKFGIVINLNKPFPFVSDEIYRGALPFTKPANAQETKSQQNVIVFFVEGFSARTINVYGSYHPDLTPNIDAFAKESMLVKNYYSHTAATYRGLLGQYCSMFPTRGGSDAWLYEENSSHSRLNHYCLNKILNKNGYRTLFFDSHIKKFAYIDEMMSSIGIDTVWTAEELSNSFLDDAKPLRPDSLSDHQFVDGFVAWLKRNENFAESSKPFMAGLYNLETHAFQSLGEDGHPYNDGRNSSLDTIHNWDHAFGKFWSYFKSSPYYKNTVVILTSDHSHYTEKPFVEAVERDPDYQGLFVDKIPLIIYDPSHSLPPVYDANYATSIDFAPSLIHLLELPNSKNAFLGSSIFSSDRKVYDGIGLVSIGDDNYIVDDQRIHYAKNTNTRDQTLDLADRLMRFIKKTELDNRLWNPDWDEKGESERESAARETNPAIFER